MRKFHRWVALVLVLPLLWIASTGILLGTARLVREKSAPYRLPMELRYSPSSIPQGTTFSALLREVEKEGRLSELKGIEFAPTYGSSERVSLGKNENRFFTPLGGEFAKLQGEDWLHTLTELHRGKYWGLPGRAIFSNIAFLAIVLAISGLFLFRRGSRWKNSRDYHRNLGGALAAPFIALWLTGSLWNFSAELRKEGTVAPLDSSTATTWESAYHSATQAYPQSAISEVHRAGNQMLVIFSDSSRFYWSPSESHLHRSWTSGGWIEPFFSIHSGKIFGSWGNLLPVTLGFFVWLISLSGAWLLWLRWRR